ncbi:MAG: zinc ribbon domain-containing protein [Actinomycetota bacterium]|nr:zinc ribbon domain-containing protein [Actinomycetota bacterium]
MPTYAYRCRTCDSAFEVQRSVTASPTATPCPQGHEQTSRVWSPVAVGGTASAPAAPSGGGGCCGGGCCG